MTVRAQTTHAVPTFQSLSSRWLRLCSLGPLAAAALIGANAIGCAGTGENVAEESTVPQGTATSAESARTDVSAVEPVQAALRNGVMATPETVGGLSMDGVGIYLSAARDTAEMTIYVVAPAESVTFSRPALYLTTQEGDHSKTDVAEFDDVTLEMGESRTFRKEADGPLMEVFANFAGEEG